MIDSYEQKRDGEIRKKQKEVQSVLHSIGDREQENDRPKRRMNPNSLRNLKNVGKYIAAENTDTGRI